MLALLLRLTLAFDFEAKVPGQLGEVEIPGELKASGVPVKLKAYLSKESEASLARHYAERFLEAGLFIRPVKQRRRDLLEPQLTAIDRARKRSYSVLMLQNKDKSVTVVLGEADVDPLVREREAAFVRLPPDAAQVLVSSGEAGRTVSFVTRLPPKAVLEYYGKVLEGWKPGGAGRFTAPDGRELEIATKPRPDASTVVSIIERRP